jgi:hypothetical protein
MMRDAKREKSEKDYEMTSKSRILEQMQLKSVKLEVMHQQSETFQKTVISD